MKPFVTSLLAVREQARRIWFGPESLKAANHDGPLDSQADQRDPAAVAPLQKTKTVAAANLNVAAAPRNPEQAPSADQAAVEHAPVEAAVHAQADGADHAHEEGDGDLHDHDHSEGLCVGLLSEQAWLAADPTLSSSGAVSLSTPLAALDQTFLLHSNPGASKTIYLDFNGHSTSGTSWNNSTMGSSFYSPAYSTDADASTFSSTS